MSARLCFDITMTNNESRALVLVCVLVAGILLGIMIGRAQAWDEIAHSVSGANPIGLVRGLALGA